MFIIFVMDETEKLMENLGLPSPSNLSQTHDRLFLDRMRRDNEKKPIRPILTERRLGQAALNRESHHPGLTVVSRQDQRPENNTSNKSREHGQV